MGGVSVGEREPSRAMQLTDWLDGRSGAYLTVNGQAKQAMKVVRERVSTRSRNARPC